MWASRNKHQAIGLTMESITLTSPHQSDEPLGLIPEIAKDLLGLGMSPIPVKRGEKRTHLKNWNREKVTQTQLQEHFTGNTNIGLALGGMSNNAVSLDPDWIEASVYAHKLIISGTITGARVLGRENDFGQFIPRQLLFSCPEITKQSITAPKSLLSSIAMSSGSCTIIELLANGQYIVIPPSLHITGKHLYWYDYDSSQMSFLLPGQSEFKLTEITSHKLTRYLNRIAGGALLMRIWPQLKGSRHHAMLHLIGACIHSEWTIEDIREWIIPLVQVLKDDEKHDRLKSIESSLLKAEAGENLSGLPNLSETIGDEICDCLVKWWGLGRSESNYGLIINGEKIGTVSISNQSNHLKTWPELIPLEPQIDL